MNKHENKLDNELTAGSWLESTNGGYDSKPRRIISMLYSRFNHKNFVDLPEIIWHSVDDADSMYDKSY